MRSPPLASMGEAIRKVRWLIQKHFLSGFPHSLTKRSPDLLLYAKLAAFNHALDICFSPNKNIANIYGNIEFNLFNEEFLLKMPSNIDKTKAIGLVRPSDKRV